VPQVDNWANKYRPKTLNDVIGQDWSKQIIRGALENMRHGHSRARSWLFSGSYGCGKTTLARILGKAFACPSPTPTGEACQVCDSCQAIEEDNSPNYNEIDAASKSGVEDAKKLVQEVYSSPMGNSPYKTIALDEAHGLSKAAQNALLKTIEEPSPTTHFMFLTTDPEKLLYTIRSRCVPVQLEPPPRRLLVEHLARICNLEEVHYEEDALETIVIQKHGHVRDVLTLAETIQLGGSLTLENVRKNLHLDLDDHTAKILAHSGSDWDRTAHELEVLCQDNAPNQVWAAMKRVIPSAALYSVAPSRVPNSGNIQLLVDKFGTRLSTAAKWVLKRENDLMVRTDTDLIVATVLLREQLGADTAPTEVKKIRMGEPKSKRRINTVSLHTQDTIPRDLFAATLGFNEKE
jgi:DNA polymerase III subunit gamma/tau